MPAAPRLTIRERAEFRLARALARLPHRAQVWVSGKPPVVIDGQRLHPEIQLTLALMEKRGDPPVESLTPVEARRRTTRQAVAVAARVAGVGAVRDLEIPGPAGPLPARHYAPEEPGGPHGLLVFLHGGGFVIGDLDSHDGVCRMLCRHAGVHVLAVDYRLAPEHRFPAAVDDTMAALRWAAEHAAELGADPARIAIGGDSAGGNLATVACQLAARDGGPLPAAQLLIYPVTDSVHQAPSRSMFAEGFYLTRSEMDWFTEQYVTPGDDTADARMSPVLATDLAGQPPAVVVTAGFDPLRDEGEAYAMALRDAGVPVVLRRFTGLIHAFVNMTGVSPACHDALVETAGALRAVLATAPAPAPAAAAATDPPAAVAEAPLSGSSAG
jgi:acetyl esterase